MVQSAPEVPPEKIGPYRVLGSLGHGGMGEVLRGYDDRLARAVALKRIRPGGLDPEKARSRLQREARAVAKLNHPAIVQIYDWVESADDDWLVMELIVGRSLSEILSSGPLQPERAAILVRQVASGLAAAHEAGLVHRDLKAANVMVTIDPDRTQRAKILDFGLAKEFEFETEEGGKLDSQVSLTLTGHVIGTVTSMSPEQAMGHELDHRSDLFSLGILLYEMLSGVLPFVGTGVIETLSRICTVRETPISALCPQVPADLAKLVNQLLEKSPERRPASARVVVAELDRVIEASAKVSSAPTADSWSVAEPIQQSTLFEGTPRTEKEAASHTFAVLGRLRHPWRVAVTGAVLVAGSWAAFSLLSPEINGSANDAQGSTAQPPEELTSHDYYQRGMKLLERYDRKGNIDRAVTELQRALAREESSAPALAGLARAYWLDAMTGSKDPIRLEQASAAAERAVASDEYLATAWVNRGLVRWRQGKYEDAFQDLRQALVLEPLNADAHYGIALVRKSQANLSAAETEVRQAIQKQPVNWVYYTLLGELCFEGGRYEEAEKAYQRIIELAPANFFGLRNLGAVLYMQGKLEAAASLFQQALQIQPEPSLYSSLGTLYFSQGLYTQSVAAFEKAIDMGGYSNTYHSWGNLGDAYRWAPDSDDKAKDAYLRAIQLLKEREPNPDIGTQTRLALYLAKRGDQQEALKLLESIPNPSKDEASSWFRLATAREICGQRDEALAALQAALQAGFSLSEVQRDPELLELREDIQYHRLLMKLGAEKAK